MIEQVERECDAGRVDRKIALQPFGLREAHDADAGETPLGSINTDWLNDAVLDQLDNPIGIHVAGQAKVVEGKGAEFPAISGVFSGGCSSHGSSASEVGAGIERQFASHVCIGFLRVFRLGGRQRNFQHRIKVAGLVRRWDAAPFDLQFPSLGMLLES